MRSTATILVWCAAVTVAALLCATGSAVAGPVGNPYDGSASAMCPVDDPQLDRYSYLRALSLDLRGDVPTVSEYTALDSKSAVPEKTVNTWLASDAFADEAVRVHRDLLWNSIDNVRPFPANTTLAYAGAGKLWWRSGGAFSFKARGARVPCADEPATFDADGEIVFKPRADGTTREGWVMVKPYWAPDTAVKVCAGDAQAGQTTANGISCDQIGYAFDPSCGCGPNLRWCVTGARQVELVNSWSTALELQIRDIIKENRPYTDLFSERYAYVNGPIAFFWKHQTQVATRLRFEPAPLNAKDLPYLKWTDIDKWIKVKLGPQHAGFLTAPAFLLRFQTNRARANRFYNTFLCQPFQPPDSGIPVSDAAVLAEPNLQKRAGCKYCHALLEPVASYWGRWTPNGAGYLSVDDFPAHSDACEKCATTGQGCTNDCKRHYFLKALSEPEKDFLGMLDSYVFLQDVHTTHVQQGPRLMALSAFADGRLPECMARTTAARLLGRELSDDEQAWTKQLAVDFAQGGYSYRALIKAVVTSDVYRRVR